MAPKIRNETLEIDEHPPIKRVCAIIVGLERFRPNTGGNSLGEVGFAHADADAFAETLRDIYKDLEESDLHIEVVKNSAASLVALKETLSYEFFRLSEEDLFVFYYAGHGFHGASGNRLSAYDTSPYNIFDTTLDLQEDLLAPLSRSACKRALLFVDACAANARKVVGSRDVVNDLDLSEVAAFLDASWYCGVFLSCSPGEKSYPSSKLGHGVWTGHLLQALSGKVEGALTRERWLTDVGLRDWLRIEVPRFITREMSIRGTQTPQAIVSSSNTFRIRYVASPPTIPKNAILSEIALKNTNAYLESIETGPIRNLDGFRRGFHTVPDHHSVSADSWVCRLLKTRVSDEIQEIYEAAKDALGLRKKDTRKETDVGGGNLDTPAFRYSIEAKQNPDDPAEYAIIRWLSFRQGWRFYREEIDDLFGSEFERLVVTFVDQPISFEELVDMLEDVKELNGGSVEEDDRTERAVYRTEDDAEFVFDLNRNRFEIAIRGSKCVDLVESVQGYNLGLTGEAHPMLPSPQDGAPSEGRNSQSNATSRPLKIGRRRHRKH